MLLRIYCLVLICVYTNAQIIVNTPNGQVKGTQEPGTEGSSFYMFQQIPYAKTPTGSLRFKEPQPADKWEGVFDATIENKMCYQQTADEQWGATEDCLYVNVYTPTYPSPDQEMPVMVYFYGGGFINGAANFHGYGPHYWMEQGVIIVTVSYRVGVLGFLSTGDTVIPGNYGLKDQQLALKWVQQNIQSFGGDPNKVTIFGQSAGGASVTFHLISQNSAGLFRAAIAQSGSALCSWAYQWKHKSIASIIATIINPNFNPNATSQEILDFLQNVAVEDLVLASTKVPAEWHESEIINGFLFTPVVENEHETAFLTERMYAAIENGHAQRVPLLMGINSEEMIWDGMNKDDFKWTAYWLDNNANGLVNENMQIHDQNQIDTVGAAIREVYTNGKFEDHLGDAIEFFSDTSFGRAIIQHAKLQSQFSDVYFYQFSYQGTLPGERPYYEGAYKVAHNDDNSYLWVFGNYTNLNTFPPGDVLTSKRYRTLFSNFAKDLNPTSESTDILGINYWPTVKPGNFQYLDLNETLTIKTDLKKQRHDGWVDIYNRYAAKPYYTF
ncbi:para-nitrobenzyl esterase-like [Diabrotica undecimpunctata]|uniref:para-nitrobenzyl esterase-like n=1 Tax=Diabrotica undecimpunctata TaxID=50387 RepID=UPI003B6419EF